MPQPNAYIVGRDAEVAQFASLVSGEGEANGRLPHWLLNIYGPGGIGKTVVGQKMQDYARAQRIPLAFIDGIRPDLTPDRILYAIKEGVTQEETLISAFADFDRAYQEHLIIQEVLQRSGGINTLFEVVGSVKDAAGLAKIIGSLGQAVTEQAQRKLSNRFVLERYLRGVERVLTDSLAQGLATVVAEYGRSPALIIDTYEEMEGIDDWMQRTLAPALPEGMKVVVLGRNALPKINFDWGEYGQALQVMELSELAEPEAKAYLKHHGLQDTAALSEIYRFTGGYPLLLVLIVHLAREAGGWNEIGALESAADRDHVATKLLKRILREERAKEVQAFLEKGVVARWFTPEVVSVVMGMSPEEGRAVYDKLKRHSFVERHPYGLKFHDKIRELLLARLKFNKSEYGEIVRRLTDYYAEKAGVQREEGAEAVETGSPKYIINIHGGSGINIGDDGDITQTFQSGTNEV